MRGQRYKVIAFLIFFAIIQISALNYIEIFGVKPNILLASVILLALYKGSRAGIETGIIAGSLYDLGSSATFGLSIVSYMLCGYAVGFLGKNVYKEHVFLRSLIVLVFSLATGLIYYLVLSIFQASPPFVPSIKYVILPYSLYTTLASPFLFLILRKPFQMK